MGIKLKDRIYINYKFDRPVNRWDTFLNRVNEDVIIIASLFFYI